MESILSRFIPVALIVVASCRTVPPIAIPVPEYPQAEARAVYRAVLNSMYPGPDRPSTIVVWDSLMHGLTNMKRLGALADRPSRSTLESFERESTIPFSRMRLGPHQFGAFPRDVQFAVPIVFHSDSDWPRIAGRGARALDSLENARVPLEMPSWLDLAAAYPGAWGLEAFTRVGFNESRTEAIVEVTHGCGGSCRSYESFILRRSDSNWSVVHRVVDESMGTDGLGFGSLRYIAPGGVAYARARRERDSVAIAIADSIVLANTPRRLRGTVTHRATGRPVVNANVLTFVATGWGPATRTDAAGYFQFDSIALGGSVFVVCPGRVPAPEKWLGGGGFDLYASTDTTLTVSVKSVATCWSARRARPLVAGMLESDAFVKSAFPEVPESNVYKAVIEGLYPKRQARPLLRPLPFGGCELSDDGCGVPILPLLVRENAIDSTAVSRLGSPLGDRAPFSAAFARETGLHLFTTGEEQYFAREAIAADRESSIQDSAGHFFRTVRQVHHAVPSIVSLGRIAFDAGYRRALVRIRTEAGGWTNNLETLLLTRAASGWRITSRGLEKELLSGATQGDACVPARLPARVVSDIASLSGLYDIRFISTTGTRPRRDSLRIRIERDARSRTTFEVVDLASGSRDERTGAAISMRSGNAAIHSKGNLIALHPPGPHMEIRRTGSGAFFGSWESGSYSVPVDRKGNRLPSAAGYFCARVVP